MRAQYLLPHGPHALSVEAVGGVLFTLSSYCSDTTTCTASTVSYALTLTPFESHFVSTPVKFLAELGMAPMVSAYQQSVERQQSPVRTPPKPADLPVMRLFASPSPSEQSDSSSCSGTLVSDSHSGAGSSGGARDPDAAMMDLSTDSTSTSSMRGGTASVGHNRAGPSGRPSVH